MAHLKLICDHSLAHWPLESSCNFTCAIFDHVSDTDIFSIFSVLSLLNAARPC